MKTFAIALAAAATLVAGLSATPAAAASWNWGFSTPWVGVQSDRSVNSKQLRTRDSLRVGPFKWSGGLNLSSDHKTRCAARYRSYNSVTDTYVTFGGESRRCRL
jgi:hypothetical protein